MILIIEGSDKSGKSTVINALLDDKRIHHRAVRLKQLDKPMKGLPSEADKIYYLYKGMFDVCLADHETIYIFDRSYPSEMVYSIKRGYDALLADRWWELDKRIKEKAILVHLSTSFNNQIKRMRKDKENYLKESEVKMINKRYKQFLLKTKIPNIKLKTPQKVEKMVDKIIKFINEYQRYQNRS